MADNAAIVSDEKTGGQFTPIDPRTDGDWLIAYWSHKEARIFAEFVPAGKKVDTILKDGHRETTKTAGPEGGYKVTNPDGEQYLVDPQKFTDRYETTGNAGEYRPKLNPVRAVQIDKDVSFTAPWGEEMRIKAGGWLVKTKDGEIYGIQPDEFGSTYKLDPSLMREFNLAVRRGRETGKPAFKPGTEGPLKKRLESFVEDFNKAAKRKGDKDRRRPGSAPGP